MNWDTSQIRTWHCDVASATTSRTDVVLHFGVRRGEAELQAELLRRIVLDPVAAERLQQLLVRLVSESEPRSKER